MLFKGRVRGCLSPLLRDQHGVPPLSEYLGILGGGEKQAQRRNGSQFWLPFFFLENNSYLADDNLIINPFFICFTYACKYFAEGFLDDADL